MESIIRQCRMHSGLTAVQANLLQKIDRGLPFIADLAHAHLTVYVETIDAGKYIVLRHYRPHTFLSQVELAEEGDIVKVMDEPLVTFTFGTGRIVHGQREWKQGQSLDMYTYPIRYGNDVIAVVSIETSHHYAVEPKYHQLLDAVEFLLLYARKAVAPEKYGRINAGNGIIIADRNDRIIYANTSATRIFKTLGIGNIIGLRTNDKQLIIGIKRETVDTSRPFERELQVGELVLLRRDIRIEEGGQLQRHIIIIVDVTEIRKKDREIKIKSAVIQEIHHRVKNNLQTIASLLRLQARRSKSPEVKSALQESTNRILSMSIVHEFLSRQDDEQINVLEVSKNILRSVAPNMLPSDFQLETEFRGPEIVLPSKTASNMAIIINELVLNAIQHGFCGSNRGKISLLTNDKGDYYTIDLYDDGVGLPEDFDINSSRSLGLQIIRTLVGEEMQGEFSMYSDKGTHSVIKIPKKQTGGDEW